MGNERGSTGIVQIMVALIGVAGSLGVAYLTTGRKFDAELEANGAQVAALKSDFQSVRPRLDSLQAQLERQTREQQGAQERIGALTQALAQAEQRNSQLETQLAGLTRTAQATDAAVTRVALRAGVLSQLQQLHPVPPPHND